MIHIYFNIMLQYNINFIITLTLIYHLLQYHTYFNVCSINVVRLLRGLSLKFHSCLIS